MADITKCLNDECPKREKCKRFMVKPHDKQSFAIFGKKRRECEYYIPYD